jgi:hypothetical protein
MRDGSSAFLIFFTSSSCSFSSMYMNVKLDSLRNCVMFWRTFGGGDDGGDDDGDGGDDGDDWWY